jgi:sarcosine oxidase subunit delta
MDASSDGEWIGYLFFHDNRAGVIREWWRHDPSNYFFIAERETVTDEIVRTYAAGELVAQETKP